MGKVLWHITMSLDGFIASPGDGMAWLAHHLGPNPTADEVLAQIGALLIGHRTYQLAKTEEGKPYGGAWTGPMFVLTHDAPETAAAGFTLSAATSRRPSPPPRASLATGTSSSLVLTPPSSASTRACSTRSWCTSRPSCLVMVSGCSTVRGAPTSSSSGSA